MLDLQSFTVVRNQIPLFKPITGQFSAGDAVQIVGPNGRGKTSLLRVLVGIYSGYQGNYLWQSRLQPIYIGHKTGLHPGTTLIESLKQLCLVYGIRFENFDPILLRLELMGFESTPITRLSAGQTRKIALAPLFHPEMQARPWLLDEPFTSLDHQTCLMLEQLFLQHLNSGGSLIFTSHQKCLDDSLQSKIKKLSLEVQPLEEDQELSHDQY